MLGIKSEDGDEKELSRLMHLQEKLQTILPEIPEAYKQTLSAFLPGFTNVVDTTNTLAVAHIAVEIETSLLDEEAPDLQGLGDVIVVSALVAEEDEGSMMTGIVQDPPVPALMETEKKSLATSEGNDMKELVGAENTEDIVVVQTE